MSDTTWCILLIGGTVHVDDLPRLADAINADHPDDSRVLETLGSSQNNNYFLFNGVRTGDMSTELCAELKLLNLSYSWENGSGDDFWECIRGYDVATGKESIYSCADSEITLTLSRAEKPEELARARLWADFHSRLKLTVLRTAHQRIEMIRNPVISSFLYPNTEGAGTGAGATTTAHVENSERPKEAGRAERACNNGDPKPMILDEDKKNIRRAWTRESAMAPEAWTEDTPSKDQCAVTACLVFERFGVDIVRGQAFLPDGSVDSHYWNEGVDLTADQYPDGTRIAVRDGVQGAAAYAYLLSNPDLVRRLAVLRARYDASPA